MAKKPIPWNGPVDQQGRPAPIGHVSSAAPRVVEATWAASSSMDPLRKGLAKQIEAAMSDAIKQHLGKEAHVIKAAMMAARQDILNKFYGPRG